MNVRLSRNTVVILAVTMSSCGVYVVLRFLCSVEQPSLGITRGSTSEAESRADAFWIGTYTPTRRALPLKDLSVVHVPDAWVERAWKPELTFLLQNRRVAAQGYYLYIPIHPDDSTGLNTIWPFKFALELDQKGQHLSRYPGIGYNPDLGFHVFLDWLPEVVRFTVEQKEHEHDLWNQAVPVEVIEFRRAF